MSAPTLDAASENTSDGSGVSSITWSHTCSGTNRLLLVSFYYESGVSVTSVTYNGVALTQVWEKIAPTIAARCYCYRLIAPDTGTHDVVVTLSGISADLAGGAASWNGVNQTTPLGTAVTNAALSGGPATVDITYNSDEIAFGAIGTISIDVTLDSGTATWEDEVDGAAGHISAGGYKSGGGSTSISWTLTTGTVWAVGAVAIKPIVDSTPQKVYRRRIFSPWLIRSKI